MSYENLLKWLTKWGMNKRLASKPTEAVDAMTEEDENKALNAKIKELEQQVEELNYMGGKGGFGK